MNAAYSGELTGRLRSYHGCGLAKVKRKAAYRVTSVAAYVARRQSATAHAVEEVLREWARRLARRVRAIAERHAVAERVVHEVIADRPELVKAKETLSPADQLMADVLDALDLKGMSQDVADELYPEMRKAFRKAGVQAADTILGKAPKDLVQVLDRKALAYAKKRAAELVGGSGEEWSITEATRDGLRKIVSRGVREGWSPHTLSQEIEESYPFSPGRADTIARTELAMAHVDGNVQGWRETGQVDRKRSILGDLHEHEDECDENVKAGAVGIDEDFPSGDAQPPYHPNCVCDVLPVLKDEDE